ncbi:MAG: dihydrofolate reductase [Gammaproteobacteria bacterium]|nr:dihydrofolate reductase [Gammaproteobacteria bacterium]
MRIVAIAAMSENRVIGSHNKLPWHLPADLHHFKALTMDKPILMGRRTYDSIGRALPGRCNIVITREAGFHAPGCVVANSIEGALDAAAYSEEIFIIGGALLYEHMLPRIQRLYLTIVHHKFEGDAFFPELNMKEWKETHREDCEADETNPFSYSFITLDRV